VPGNRPAPTAASRASAADQAVRRGAAQALRQPEGAAAGAAEVRRLRAAQEAPRAETLPPVDPRRARDLVVDAASDRTASPAARTSRLLRAMTGRSSSLLLRPTQSGRAHRTVSPAARSAVRRAPSRAVVLPLLERTAPSRAPADSDRRRTALSRVRPAPLPEPTWRAVPLLVRVLLAVRTSDAARERRLPVPTSLAGVAQ